HRRTPTDFGMVLSDAVIPARFIWTLPNCLNQSCANQRDQPLAGIKTVVDIQSRLRCFADGAAFGDGFAECGLCRVQSSEMKLSASATYFDIYVSGRKLKTVRNTFAEINFHQFIDGPRRAQVMQSGLKLEQRIGQDFRLDRGKFLQVNWDAAD